MTTEEAKKLLERYLGGDCTPEESSLLEAWWDDLQAEYPWAIPDDEGKKVHDRMLSKIKERLGEELPVRRIPWRRYIGIAAAVLAITIGLWYWRAPKRESASYTLPDFAVNDVPPGGNHAVLTIGGGKRIVLDSAANGLLATQGNERVFKHDGELSYTEAAEGKGSNGTAAVTFNTLATPRGGQYQLLLPDGSKVWLDAESSITYPSAFIGPVRQVRITGQAYIEVVHNAKQPFQVQVRGETIRDIGTSFNIDAYEDEEADVITLASGEVLVGTPERNVTLQRPGQQVTYRDGSLGTIGEGDLVSVLAWKNGLFDLRSADIAAVMRQIGRWYDVNVVFEGAVPPGHITGQVPRNTNLATVLEVLQKSGIHFRLQGKTVVVTP
jgi:transmembrane sensor